MIIYYYTLLINIFSFITFYSTLRSRFFLAEPALIWAFFNYSGFVAENYSGFGIYTLGFNSVWRTANSSSSSFMEILIVS